MEENKIKNCIVLGAGRSGISATKLLKNNGYNVFLYDEDENKEVDTIAKNFSDLTNINISTKDFKDSDIESCEFCVISPGIPKTSLLYKKIVSKNILVISELELGYLNDKGKICAITGSNGKTTVTTLMGEIMKDYNEKTFVVGNNGIPYTSIVSDTSEDSITVLECSSFQLEDIVKFKPKVSTILNLSPDHLDRYKTYVDYINAKINITSNLDENDYLILNYEDELLRNLAINKNIFRAKVLFFSSKRPLNEGAYIDKGIIYFRDKIKTIKLLDVKDLKLIGDHNYENVMACILMAYYMGASLSDIVEVCKNFNSLPHRLEFVRERAGVKYYNDSKATNTDAVIKALDAMDDKVILIAGGKDKGIDYGELILKVKEKVRYMILIGEAKRNIQKKARSMNYTNVIHAENMKEAVDIATRYANIGDVVLLSPACSSYDMYKNFEERGDDFKNLVMNIK